MWVTTPPEGDGPAASFQNEPFHTKADLLVMGQLSVEDYSKQLVAFISLCKSNWGGRSSSQTVRIAIVLTELLKYPISIFTPSCISECYSEQTGY